MSAVNRRGSHLNRPVCGALGTLLLCQTLALPARANDDTPPPTIVRVSAIYSILASERETVEACRPILISERELMQRQGDQQPWALKYQKPLAAVGLGLASAVFYRDHMEGVLDPKWDKWKGVFIAANAVQGYMLGPGAAIGAWGGAELGLSLSGGKLLAALGGDIIGSVLGAMVWSFLFPPNPALAPLSNDPDGDIPVQRFLKDKVCAPTPTRRFDAPQYRVEFTLDGVLHYTDLAYDPGEALAIAADGSIIGPSRERLDE
jgi:hypothetical protein